MTAEEWRPVVGWEDGYEVSDHGRVRSIDRTALCRNGRSYRVRGAVLSLHYNPINGYATVMLSINGKTRRLQVHVMVLEAFVGPAPDGEECRHLDGDATNDARGNLCWGTKTENQQDRWRHHRAKLAAVTP